MRLNSKIAIITGGASGMGEASAILFAREGAKVAVVDMNQAGIDSVVQRITDAGGRAIGIVADCTSTEDVQRVAARTVAELGRPNVLFNNAGTNVEGRVSILKVEEANFDRTVAVNLKAPWLMMKYVVPHMIEAGGGSIVTTASVGAFLACSTAGYCASKAGAVALTRNAAAEFAAYGIRANSICPGVHLTPMTTGGQPEAIKQGVPKVEDVMSRVSLLSRMGSAEEIANLALFLASDESSYITGVAINHDGGWTAMSGLEIKA